MADFAKLLSQVRQLSRCGGMPDLYGHNIRHHFSSLCIRIGKFLVKIMSTLCDLIYKDHRFIQFPLCFTRMVSALNFLEEI